MASNIYLKIAPTGKLASDFFKGSSVARYHVEHIEVSAWGTGFEQPISAVTKSSDLAPAARCNHKEVTFSKYYDNATDDLMKATWIGQCLDACFYLYRPLTSEQGGEKILTDKTNRYLQIFLGRCFIKGMDIKGEAEELSKEDITLVYNYIQYGFLESDKKLGKLDTAGRKMIDWSWNNTTNNQAFAGDLEPNDG